MTVLIYSYGIPSDKYPMNGIFAFDQARALASLGHNVIMAVLDLRSIRRKRKLFLDLYDKSDVHVVHFSFPIGVMPSKLHDFIDRILGSILIKFSCSIFQTPDIIHSHFLRQSYTVSKTFNGHSPRLFSTIHDGHLMNGINKSEKSKLYKIKSNSTIISVSPKLSEVLASNSISSVILNNMIDESIFRHSFNSINIPKANVVSAGALDDNKGMKDLIFAWKELPTWILTKLIILGDGPKRKEIEELIISYNLNDRVKIVGAYDRHQFAKYLNTSKFFILVSKKESFGVVYAEALMHGVPVIATKCGGPESLVNETNGLLIDVGNHSQLVDAIITMEKKYNEFDSATISRDIISAYGTRVVTQKLIEIYSDRTNIS